MRLFNFAFSKRPATGLAALLLFCALTACTGPSQVVIIPPPQAKPDLKLRKPVRGLHFEPLQIVRPDFPAAATTKNNGALTRSNGWVHLAFAIDQNGVPKKIRLLAESPKNMFSDATVAALKKSRYNQPTLHNKPIWINHVEMLYSFDHYGDGSVSCLSPGYAFINPKYIAPDADNVTEYEFTVRKTGLQDKVSQLTPAVEYPPYAAARNINGKVLLGFTVSSEGSPENLRVIEASPSCTGFAEAAMTAVERLKLQPEKGSDASYAGEYYIYQLNFDSSSLR